MRRASCRERLGKSRERLGPDMAFALKYEPGMPNAVGTIRSATSRDAAGLARLFAAAGGRDLGDSEIVASLARGHVIVFDVGSDALGAAAFVVLDCVDDREVHGHIQYLVVHPSLAGTGAENQLITAVLAVCEASGCIDLTIDGSPRFSIGELVRV